MFAWRYRYHQRQQLWSLYLDDAGHGTVSYGLAAAGGGMPGHAGIAYNYLYGRSSVSLIWQVAAA